MIDSLHTHSGDELHVQGVTERLLATIGQVVVGQATTGRLLFAALLAGGHVLLDEVPGTGKTTLAKTMARALGLTFARIQFTPDLLPSDVTGLYWFNQAASRFEFRPGPVFAQILLADEINRATPRTQSALLEAMAEHQVTIEGVTHPLPDPFLVIATQNPVEMEGTFPLPEAQVDRFLMRLRLGYPDEAAELEMLARHGDADPLSAIQPLPEFAGKTAVDQPSADESVPPPNGLAALQAAIRAVRVDDDVRGYIVALTRASRDLAGIELGVSPRGTLFLFRAAKAYAATAGRDYVIPDDVKAVAVPVLAHRLMMDTGFQLRGGSADAVIRDLLATVAVPVEAS